MTTTTKTTRRVEAGQTVRVRCVRCRAATERPPARGLVGTRLGTRVYHVCTNGDCRTRALRGATITYDVDVGWVANAWAPNQN